MKKNFAAIISALLLAVVVISIPTLGKVVDTEPGIELHHDLEEDIFDE